MVRGGVQLSCFGDWVGRVEKGDQRAGTSRRIGTCHKRVEEEGGGGRVEEDR